MVDLCMHANFAVCSTKSHDLDKGTLIGYNYNASQENGWQCWKLWPQEMIEAVRDKPEELEMMQNVAYGPLQLR